MANFIIPDKFKKEIQTDDTSSFSKLNNLKKRTIDDIDSLTEKLKNMKLENDIHDRNKKSERKKLNNTEKLSPSKLPSLGKKNKTEKAKMETEHKEEMENELKKKKELLNLINKYGLNELMNNLDNIPNQDKEKMRKILEELMGKPVYIDRPNKRKTLSNHSNQSSYSKKKTKSGGKNKKNKTKNNKNK